MHRTNDEVPWMNASNGKIFRLQHPGMNGETYIDEVPWMNASNDKIFTASEHAAWMVAKASFDEW